MKVALLNIGDEVLCGDVVNTNASFLAKYLNEMGFNLICHLVISDNQDKIHSTLDYLFSISDFVFTSGGLGPTKDDLTKEAIASYFGQELKLREDAKKDIENLFVKRGREMSAPNLRQAMFPENAIVLPNDYGTAPGAIFFRGEQKVILLPGPPRELKPMFKNYVLPYLKDYTPSIMLSRTYQVVGIGESDAEIILDGLLSANNPSLAPYAKFASIEYKMIARADTSSKAEKLILPLELAFKKRMEPYIVGNDGDSLEMVVSRRLEKEGLSISCAESCTGGLFSSTLISIEGASKIFDKSFITYSTESKHEELGVTLEVLAKKGAVSAECADMMVRGVLERSKSDISLAITGFADGETAGLVYIGLVIQKSVYIFRTHLLGSRNEIRRRIVTYCFYKIWQSLENKPFGSDLLNTYSLD